MLYWIWRFGWLSSRMLATLIWSNPESRMPRITLSRMSNNNLVLSKRMRYVMLISPLCAMASTFAGMVVSFNYDLPTNQTICIAACALFAAGATIKRASTLVAGIRIH